MAAHYGEALGGLRTLASAHNSESDSEPPGSPHAHEAKAEYTETGLEDSVANPSGLATPSQQEVRPAEELCQHARLPAVEDEECVQKLVGAAIDIGDVGDSRRSPLIVHDVADVVRAAVRDEMSVFEDRMQRIELMLESLARNAVPDEIADPPEHTSGDVGLGARP